ncbi:MAG: ElyC/SanA/YdcF family protein [Leptolyngbyaceae bacterium]|nr:ElyC/SanA/YdcF family protein [Leptolyngbyaceae bacterium]
MPEILTRALLIALLIWLVWYVINQLIPKQYLTILGGFVLVLFFVLAFQDPTDRIIGSVWEILSFPLKPLGLSIVLLAMALRKGAKEVQGNLVMWALIVLLVFSTPIFVYWLTQQTQTVASQLSARTDSAEPAEIIAVVGDGFNPAVPAYGGDPQSSNPEDGFDDIFVSRLRKAGDLYVEEQSKGGTPFVVVTPGRQLDIPGKDIPADVRAILAQGGVSPERVEVDLEGRDIRSSAVAVREFVAEQGLEETGYQVILVAPALKIRRARAAFARELNILDDNVIAAPTNFYGFQIEGEDLLVRIGDLVPRVEALMLSTRLIEEYLATIYYFLRGWLINPLGL